MPAPAGFGPLLPPLVCSLRTSLASRRPCALTVFAGERISASGNARSHSRARGLLLRGIGALFAKCECGPSVRERGERGTGADVPDHRSSSHRLRVCRVRGPPLGGRRVSGRTPVAPVHGHPVLDRREGVLGFRKEGADAPPARGAARRAARRAPRLAPAAAGGLGATPERGSPPPQAAGTTRSSEVVQRRGRPLRDAGFSARRSPQAPPEPSATMPMGPRFSWMPAVMRGSVRPQSLIL